jgi:hypothetical protein
MALSGVFKVFDEGNDVVKNIKSVISSGIWSGGSNTLTAYYTQSAQSASNAPYYLDVYKTNPQSDTEAEVQFSITYGHLEGSGSLGTKGAATGNRATAAIHSQFVNLLLGPGIINGAQRFTYAGSTDAGTLSKHFYAISVRRARMREKIDPGNWELHLDSGNANQVKLIDDSAQTNDPTSGIGGRVFNVISGSIQTGTAVHKSSATDQAGGGYGLFYPDMGLILLNATQVDSLVADVTTVTGSNTLGGNVLKFYESLIQGSLFQARREERLSSTHYFCRAGNKQFNFSNNPTFFTSSTGDFTQPTFHKDPKTYITTVGLYNGANELLAVAKLSKPVLKSYSREALIKVKLDF